MKALLHETILFSLCVNENDGIPSYFAHWTLFTQ